MSWNFPVTPGLYQVRLYFSELWSGASSPGERVFDVSIQGLPVLSDYDVIADVGSLNKGVMKAFTVTAQSNISIDFKHEVQNPAIKAIEILALTPDSSPRHDVGTIGPGSGQRLGGPLDGFDTPTLLGLWDTAPYLHDGSAATVKDVLTTANPTGQHGDISSLTSDQVDQLVQYLLQLETKH